MSHGKKVFENAGYDQEDLYFHKLNQQLIESNRRHRRGDNLPALISPKNNVLQFKPKQKAATQQARGGGSRKKAA